jgi:hypothetical protein
MPQLTAATDDGPSIHQLIFAPHFALKRGRFRHGRKRARSRLTMTDRSLPRKFLAERQKSQPKVPIPAVVSEAITFECFCSPAAQATVFDPSMGKASTIAAPRLIDIVVLLSQIDVRHRASSTAVRMRKSCYRSIAVPQISAASEIDLAPAQQRNVSAINQRALTAF